MRAINLKLDEFGRAALSYNARMHGTPAEELVRQAAASYLGSIESGRTAATRYPRFRRTTGRRSSGEAAESSSASVEFFADEWAALAAESQRQQVAVEAVLEHAILLYLADLDGGRAALREGL